MFSLTVPVTDFLKICLRMKILIGGKEVECLMLNVANLLRLTDWPIVKSFIRNLQVKF